jgi:bifunctional DNA primase/polymerase-like protein
VTEREIDELRLAALLYASRGWHVFPLVPGTKRPACPSHPVARCDRSDPWCRDGHTGWEQRATTTDARIHRAWSTRAYGIGIACGPSRLLVLDTDQPKLDSQAGQTAAADGEATLAQLEAENGAQLPPTYTVATPSGGTHRYFVAPTGLRLGNTVGQLGPLVDTRGVGGYVVAGPTVVGRPYRVIENRPPDPLPDWIVERLSSAARRAPQLISRRPSGAPQLSSVRLSAPYITAALAAEVARVRHAPEGRRNHLLFVASIALGQLVGGSQLDEHTARDRLREACAGHITAGAFTAAEAEATITSGLTRGAAEPRTRRATA